MWEYGLDIFLVREATLWLYRYIFLKIALLWGRNVLMDLFGVISTYKIWKTTKPRSYISLVNSVVYVIVGSPQGFEAKTIKVVP